MSRSKSRMSTTKNATCNIQSCNNQTEKNNEFCILHCKKSEYSSDFKDGTLAKFGKKLAEHIINIVNDHINDRSQFSDKPKIIMGSNAFLKYLDEEELKKNNLDSKLVKSTSIVLNAVKFPARKDQDKFDYLKLLNKVKSIHFLRCEFNTSDLDIEEVKCFFDQCDFNSNWYIYDTQLLANSPNSLYSKCNFHGEVTTNIENIENFSISNNLFSNCQFNEPLHFENTDFQSVVFIDLISPVNVGNLTIENCRFDEKFQIADVESDASLVINNVLFNSEFEVSNSRFNDVKITNCNFKTVSDFSKLICPNLEISNSRFDDVANFDYLKLVKEHDDINKFVEARFEYVTFMSTASFKNSTFNHGLDLATSIFKENPNFLNSEISLTGSNRETFRLIKNSFDKIGNHIEANQYFASEMKLYRMELLNTDKTKEKFIHNLNYYISEYGQNYWRPIWITLLVLFVFYLITIGFEKNYLYKIYPDVNNTISSISSTLNNFAKGFIPFKKVLKEGMELLSLFFGIILSGLTWQIIVAVKRQTRR